MQNYIKINYQFLKQALFVDVIDRTLFILSILLTAIDYLVWGKYLAGPEVPVYLKINIYPVKYLLIIILINTVLAITAHKNEKEVGYFLFISNIIVAVLIFALELFYLANI